jgi:hypothetical protein
VRGDRPDRLAAMFERTRAEGRPAVIPFVPAGWPEADATPEIVQAAMRSNSACRSATRWRMDRRTSRRTTRRCSRA